MTALPSWLTVIRLPMPATLGEVKVYLVEGPNGAALIDTGMRDATSLRELKDQLARKGLTIADIDALVCTHHHADHAGLGRTFTENRAVAMMSAQDAESIRLFFDHPELDHSRTTFYGRHEVPDGFIERVAPMFPFFRALGEPFEPGACLEDGQQLDLGGIPFEVLITPGHTLGHLCLFQPDANLVFTGDCVIAHDATHISMRPEVQGKDPLGLFVQSLERLRDMDSPVALPGHGPLIPDLSTRAAELIAHHRTRVGQIEAALDDEPRRAYDISAQVMGDRPKAIAVWLSMSQTLGYLEHLVEQGRAQEVEKDEKVRYRLNDRSSSRNLL